MDGYKCAYCGFIFAVEDAARYCEEKHRYYAAQPPQPTVTTGSAANGGFTQWKPSGQPQEWALSGSKKIEVDRWSVIDPNGKVVAQGEGREAVLPPQAQPGSMFHIEWMEHPPDPIPPTPEPVVKADPTYDAYLDEHAKVSAHNVLDAYALIRSEARSCLMRLKTWPRDVDRDEPMKLTKVSVFGPKAIAVLDSWAIFQISLSARARRMLEGLGGSVTVG